ncbi:DUF6194 family protein [Streptomyces sp. NPDC047928]|uniref:DUF6194 family protein n=1 Tax=unclassified Streptomyces TaxID=2593676 RepID=UPI00370FF3FD
MSIDEIIQFVETLGGVLTRRPGPGDGSPEIAWGDVFFFYAPDGTVRDTAQPFATIVTKDYPGDDAAGLSRTGGFRLNVNAGRESFVRWTGHEPRKPGASGVAPGASGVDPSTADTVMAHPVYGDLGWLAVVNPGARSGEAARGLLRAAHDLARARHRRRAGSRSR